MAQNGLSLVLNFQPLSNMNTLSRRALMGVGSAAPTNVLKFTVNEDSQAGTITLTIPSGLTEQECTNIQYSLNGKTWVTFENHEQGLTITTPTLIAGDSVYFRGHATLISKSSSKYSRFTTSSPTFKISASGSVMSLIGDSETLTNFAFYNLFYGCTSLTTAPELPATTLVVSCYRRMFMGCTSLVTPPNLPATTLSNNCYDSMFSGCTSLTIAPDLPVTTIPSSCYYSMFYGCTSLINAPALPATTLANSCYNCMFQNCTSLINAPELHATYLPNSCYYQMFSGCTSLNKITMLATNISEGYCLYDWVKGVAATGTFIKNPEMTTLPTGTSGIPSGWIVKDKLGPLKFTVNAGSPSGTITLTIPSGLTQQQCTNIEYSLDGNTWVTFVNEGNGLTITTPTLNAGDSVYFRGQGTLISKSTSVYSKFTTSSSNFKISASGSVMSLIGDSETLTNYAFYDLFYNCISLTTAPKLPATTLVNFGYQNMFRGCTGLTTAPELPATTLESNCYQAMFYLCRSLTTAPELPATTLLSYCYQNMFNGCTQLNKITMLATDISAVSCLSNWVDGVAATGTFIKNPAMTTLPTGTDGIPSGWAVVDKMPIPDAVDLGLSSGLKWSSFNLGAAQPENVGLYFSWGNTEGHAKDSGYDFSQSNYNSTPAAAISTDLSPNEDAANVLLGNGWRMPTSNEVAQLVSQTDHEWTEINGKVGMKFMKKTDHSVFIFIPASGKYSGSTLQSATDVLLWLPIIYQGGVYPQAYGYQINANSQYSDYWKRCYGVNIRPVLPAQ